MSKQKSRTFSKRSFYGSLVVLVFGLSLLGVSLTASGPDFQLHLKREVPSKMTAEHLALNVQTIARWPQWFYSLKSVKTLSQPMSNSSLDHSADPTLIQEGSRLLLMMDPGKGLRKKFEVTVRVSQYIPQRLLKLEIEGESTHRIDEILKNLSWTIEFLPMPPQDQSTPTKMRGITLIRATVQAETRHWRSRLFGRLTERIVMNQVFYPNLIKLAELRQPFSADSPMEEDQASLWK